ncbi:MAG: hypothetical protein IJY93_09185 [Clostridia bacterium]|nr:hypothetical protein [Clostridia bacterium]
MRSFRRDSVNLRDMRISYIFILSLTFICAVMGMIITNQENRIHTNELENCHESLALCADALDEWSAANDDEGRYSASVRFENAVMSLPSEVETEPLLYLASGMRENNDASAYVRALADTFSLLASIDYTDGTEARELIAMTLEGVSDELGLESAEPATQSLQGEASIPPEVREYTNTVVKQSIRSLFGKNAGTLETVLSDEGDLWLVQNDNLRMSFSASDGSLEEFVYIRIGDHPSEKVSEEEQLSLVCDFYSDMRRTRSDVSAEPSGEICGFLLARITDGEEIWQSAVDSYGRIWSLIKVKR